jgi:hypothetical protein
VSVVFYLGALVLGLGVAGAFRGFIDRDEERFGFSVLAISVGLSLTLIGWVSQGPG